ncbi:MAG: histidine phosphatase family protein, partial [Kiloniellales bacterium]|nr:histidine phosphatase family protein [Kiloniellales bacterium]
YQGQQDSPLTVRGIAQAEAVGERLAEVTRGEVGLKVIASPLGRAWQTAVIVSHRLGLDPSEIALEPRIMEAAFGVWEGQTPEEAASRFPEAWAQREADKWHCPVPEGESYAGVAARLSNWLAGLDEGCRLVVVGHGSAGRILRGLYLKSPPETIFAMDEPQDSFFRLQDGSITRFDAASAGS